MKARGRAPNGGSGAVVLAGHSASSSTYRAVRVRNLSAMAVTARDLSGRTGRQTLVMGVMTLAVAELLANVRY